jgi:Nitronate monooxygenase
MRSGPTWDAMHHGAKKSACRNTPPVKCATLKTSDRASIPAFLPGFGVSVMFAGGPAIARDRRPIYRWPPQPTGSSIPSAHMPPGRETEDECAQQHLLQRTVCALHSDVQAGGGDLDEDVIRGRVGSPELTAAVSNAGGVGLFCMGPGAPEMLADQIDGIRRLSSAPFGVDFIVEETGFGPATTEAHIEVAIGKRVPLAVFFWNPPEERWISKRKRAGIKVWGTAYSVESAWQLKALGADAVIVQSQEAGGHVKSDLGAMALVPAVVDALGRIPVIAAGGIADGGRQRPRSCLARRLCASVRGSLQAPKA